MSKDTVTREDTLSLIDKIDHDKHDPFLYGIKHLLLNGSPLIDVIDIIIKNEFKTRKHLEKYIKLHSNPTPIIVDINKISPDSEIGKKLIEYVSENKENNLI